MANEPEVEYLAVEDLIDLATRILGDAIQWRDVGLLGSAAARPQTTVLGQDAYPDLWTKAAALLQSILENHALIDANKRLGWLAAAVFLEINGVPASRASNEDVYELVMDLAAGSQSIDAIAARLQHLMGHAREVWRP